MKKLALLLSITIPMLFVMVQPVAAEDVIDRACPGQGSNKPAICYETTPGITDTSDNALVGPNGIITKVTQALVFIIGAVAVLMVIIGGLRYVLSSGDQNAVSGAKNTILYAVIGLVVAISAQAIVTFVLNRL